MRAVTIMFVSAVALALVGALPATAQWLSADRERALRAEVKAAFDQYHAWFSAGRADNPRQSFRYIYG
jgi:hypothetical protein